MLQTSLDVMYARLSTGGVAPTLTTLPRSVTAIPYLDVAGRLPLLVATGTEGEDAPQVRRRSTKADNRTVDCAICKPPISWPLSKMMLHTGFHILNATLCLTTLAASAACIVRASTRSTQVP